MMNRLGHILKPLMPILAAVYGLMMIYKMSNIPVIILSDTKVIVAATVLAVIGLVLLRDKRTK